MILDLRKIREKLALPQICIRNDDQIICETNGMKKYIIHFNVGYMIFYSNDKPDITKEWINGKSKYGQNLVIRTSEITAIQDA
jgi:hypothetical protein